MKPTTTNDLVTTYGPVALSAFVILFVALAAFTHGIDWNTAIQAFYIILGANGLYLATKWQAAPGLLSTLQAVIQQLADHIQVLHASSVPTPVQPPPSDTPATN